MRILLIAIGLIFFVGRESRAQKVTPCGTPSNIQNPLAHIDPNSFRLNADGVMIVPMYVINFDRTTTFEPESIWEEVRLMNEQFRPYNICLELVGFRTVSEFQMSVIDVSEPEDMQVLNTYIIPNVLTMFVHYSIWDDDEELAGTAYNIPNSYFSVASNTFGGRMTSAHEAGHCLGLFHTFHGNPGVEGGDGTCQEFVNGSNSTTCGDYVSDSPADPYGLAGATVTSSCVYNGTTKDPNGASYSPLVRNTMSYWRVDNNNCTRNGFTSGQGGRMQTTLTFPQPLWTLVVQPVNFSISGTYTDTRRITCTTGTINTGDTGSGIFELRNTFGGFTAKKIVLTPGSRCYVTSEDRNFIFKALKCQ